MSPLDALRQEWQPIEEFGDKIGYRPLATKQFVYRLFAECERLSQRVRQLEACQMAEQVNLPSHIGALQIELEAQRQEVREYHGTLVSVLAAAGNLMLCFNPKEHRSIRLRRHPFCAAHDFCLLHDAEDKIARADKLLTRQRAVLSETRPA